MISTVLKAHRFKIHLNNIKSHHTNMLNVVNMNWNKGDFHQIYVQIWPKRYRKAKNLSSNVMFHISKWRITVYFNAHLAKNASYMLVETTLSCYQHTINSDLLHFWLIWSSVVASKHFLFICHLQVFVFVKNKSILVKCAKVCLNLHIKMSFLISAASSCGGRIRCNNLIFIGNYFIIYSRFVKDSANVLT